jgi:hypothetical protein
MAQTQKGNAALALSCYATRLYSNSIGSIDVAGQRVEEAGMRHVFANWQGRGPGRLNGSGPLVDSEMVDETVADRACVVTGAKDAEAKPAMAMNSANRRTAAFIFGNLVDFCLEGRILPSDPYST